MNDVTKIGASHLGRAAYIYLRQSTPSQVEHNRESTQRQYALAARATTLGWPSQQVIVVDEDLGLSGSGIVERNGFARLTAEVALGHVGIVLGLEVSRLARNNADWYRLLDLCGLTNTLIGDADGIYHPAMFNDRLLLGLKGTMSEAELHIIRARLNGGIRNKAARGELRRGRSASIQMRRSAPLSVLSLLASPNSDRHAASGSGSAARACRFHCRLATAVPSVGSTRATSPSIMCSPIRPMRAPMPMARAAAKSPSMARVRARNACASCRDHNGPCSSRTTMKASSTWPHTRPIAPGSPPIRIRARISRVGAP